MKYPCGQPMPENVRRAILLAGKTGFISRRLWAEHFGRGVARWERRQLAAMLERGLLQPHPNPAGRGYWVLTPTAHKMLEDENCATVRSAPIGQIHHDECLAHWLLRLTEEGVAPKWKTEAELKSERAKAFQLRHDAKDQKYPDAVVWLQALGRERCFALEYERTRKAALRYKDILWLYSRMDSVSVVIFICENLAIESAIQGRLAHLRQPSLWDRVAFSQAIEWQKNPADAPIRLDRKTFTLRDLGRSG